jgi:hypothetical protein
LSDRNKLFLVLSLVVIPALTLAGFYALFMYIEINFDISPTGFYSSVVGLLGFALYSNLAIAIAKKPSPGKKVRGAGFYFLAHAGMTFAVLLVAGAIAFVWYVMGIASIGG